MAEMNKQGFHSRGFISFLTFAGFLIMTLTGVVLYLVPYGRIAYWTDWRMLGLTKTDWGNIHIVSSLFFLIAGGYHLFYNWKAFVNYLMNKVSGGLRLKRELALTSAIGVLIIFGALYQIPPLRYIIDLNEYIKDSWIISKEYEPPFGHAEELSLKVFAKKMNIDLDKALEEFKGKGIAIENIADSLKEIAKLNRTSPMDIYMIIRKFEQREESREERVYTPESIEEKFAGTGVGRKTLPELSVELKFDLFATREKLSALDINMKDTETLRKAADRHTMTPLDILKVILVDGYVPRQNTQGSNGTGN